MKRKLFSIVTALALVLSLCPVGVLAGEMTTALDVGSEETRDNNPFNSYIKNVYGTLTQNQGKIDSVAASGTVVMNDNRASNDPNDNGHIVGNYGTVKSNRGEINTNAETGTIESNLESGVVVNNRGKILSNDGYVGSNYGTVGSNYSTGTITNQPGGVVNNNAGKVSNWGTVTNNNAGGVVFNINGGTVTTNNGGTVWWQFKVTGEHAEFSLINETGDYIQEGCTVTPAAGYYFSAPPAAKNADVVLEDGAYTIKNITAAPVELTVNTASIADAVALVRVNGEDTYYTDIKAAFDAAPDGSTIELLADVALPEGESLTVAKGKMLTLNCGDFTLSGSYGYVIQVFGTLDFLGGTLKNTEKLGSAVSVREGGTFNMADGTLEAVDPYTAAVDTMGDSDKPAKVNISGGSVGAGGRGLSIGKSTTVQLSGGTYGEIEAGSENILLGASDITVPGLLVKDPRYAFFKDGQPVALEPEQHYLEGPVTVELCTHAGAKATPIEGTETHSLTCPACGHTADAEACTYETWTDQGDGTHKGVCVCGRETEPQAHSLGDWEPEWEERTLTVTHPCGQGCGYVKTDGKIVLPPMSIEIPYGQGHTLSISSTLPNTEYRWTFIDGLEEKELGTGSSCTIPKDWDAKENVYGVFYYVSWDGDDGKTADGMTSVYVYPATLTGKPTFGSGEGKTLGEVQVTLPEGWPESGTFAWADGDETQVARGTSYAYTFTAENYSTVSDSVILWAASSGGGGGGGGGGGIVTPPVDPDPSPDEPDPPVDPDNPDPPVDPGQIETEVKVEEGITEVPEGLKNIPELDTPAKLETAMRTAVTQTGIPARDTAVYDVTLMVSTDGGKTWTPATKGNFPSGGLTVTLPYPAGTDSSYTFTVVHMFTTADFGKTPGDTESPAVTNTEAGLRFTVTGLSPISVGWKAAEKPVEPEKPVTPSRPSTGGGNSASSYRVTVERTAHGQVSSNRSYASEGGSVTLTVTPDSGYTLDTLTVTDSRGNAVKLTDQGGGRYTFHMPGRAVTVTGLFKAVRSEWENPYSDVATGAWYYEAVRYVSENGLMDGYGKGLFGPDDTLTRAQFAQILYNQEGRPAVTGGSSFTDVASGAWYANAAAWAAAEGIVSGYGDGRFGPNDPITREQLAAALWRYAGSPVPPNLLLDFPDANTASGYALDALRWAVEQGILSGDGNGSLAPQGPAARAQAAQMLKNVSDSRNRA